MSIQHVINGLDGMNDLRSVSAAQIRKWAEDVGKELADAKITKGYFLAIVTQVTLALIECQRANAKISLELAEAQRARKEIDPTDPTMIKKINHDKLIFIEPHIGYQASRKDRDEKAALNALQQLLSISLSKISSITNVTVVAQRSNTLNDLNRLNQFFQAIAAYYRANQANQRQGE